MHMMMRAQDEVCKGAASGVAAAEMHVLPVTTGVQPQHIQQVDCRVGQQCPNWGEEEIQSDKIEHDNSC